MDDDGRRNLEEEDVMGEIIREGAKGPSVGDDIQEEGAEGPAPSTGDDIELEGDVNMSFLNDSDGEGESEAGSEDEEVDRDDDYDERTEEGAVAKSGEVYILVYIACADETS